MFLLKHRCHQRIEVAVKVSAGGQLQEPVGMVNGRGVTGGSGLGVLCGLLKLGSGLVTQLGQAPAQVSRNCKQVSLKQH